MGYTSEKRDHWETPKKNMVAGLLSICYLSVFIGLGPVQKSNELCLGVNQQIISIIKLIKIGQMLSITT